MGRYRSGGSFGPDSENEPLLSSRERKKISVGFNGSSSSSSSDGIQIEKSITLLGAIGIMVGSCSGAGIFVSPTGVTQSVGSVGASLLVWIACGLLNLVLALCYAELGSALPIAGGDYAYINHVLGPFPGFLCLWIMVILIGPIASAMMGRTVGLYYNATFGLECNNLLVVMVTLFVLISASALNMFSVKWSTRLVGVFSLGKVVAMGILVITGIVNLSNGYTSNFENIFEGTNANAGAIVVAFLPGFVTYAGWDCVNALAEEMKNPKRDLPISAAVSLLLVTGLYVMINVAYFTVLTPHQFIASDAVAMSFAEKVFPNVSWIITVFVIFASTGSAFSVFLAAPRWAFAGGRDRQLPEVLSFISIKYLSPLAAIVMMTVISVFFGSATFFDVQALFNITGLQAQIKVMMALIALLHLKRTQPDLERTVKIPFLVVIVALVMLLGITVIAVYQSPLINGIGIGLFLLGIPAYYIKEWFSQKQSLHAPIDNMTLSLQRLMWIIPTSRKKS